MHSNNKTPLVGVIDIGSNSVRLVVYDRLSRVSQILFNEKSTCQLGHGLDDDGYLDPAAKSNAYNSIARFVHIARKMEVGELFAIATSAVRDAKDGTDFINELKHNLALSVEIISGKREAELAAKGIISSISNPHGFAGDLGGGSFELVKINDQDTPVSGRHTRAIGSLRLLDKVGNDIDAMRAIIREELSSIDWLTPSDATQTFYAIGGGFRSIANVHMSMEKYPLKRVHYYDVSTKNLHGFFDYLLRLDPSEWDELKGLATRRMHSFLPSILILQEVVRRTDCKNIVFSGTGIREGLLFDQLDDATQQESALTASLRDILRRATLDDSYSASLYDWMVSNCPVLKQHPDRQRLIRALCVAGDISLPIHDEFSGQWAFDHIIQSNLWGISHHERLMLAFALYHRYRRKWKDSDKLLALLSDEEYLWARLTGQLANLAFELSGGVESLLQQCTLTISTPTADDQPHTVSINTSGDMANMLPDTAEKRCDGLGEIISALASASA